LRVLLQANSKYLILATVPGIPGSRYDESSRRDATGSAGRTLEGLRTALAWQPAGDVYGWLRGETVTIERRRRARQWEFDANYRYDQPGSKSSRPRLFREAMAFSTSIRCQYTETGASTSEYTKRKSPAVMAGLRKLELDPLSDVLAPQAES
jgi:hypothetical protein